MLSGSTCSAAERFSAVLGRLEDSGFSEVSEREEGLLEGTGDSGWWCSEWPDTAAGTETQNKTFNIQPVYPAEQRSGIQPSV